MNISHKESLVKDMISVCSLSSDELSDASRMEFIDKAISWHYTDRDDYGRTAKIKGCPYWTKSALDRFLLGSEKHKDGIYRHEHIIPRIIFKDAILNEYKSSMPGDELGKDFFSISDP